MGINGVIIMTNSQLINLLNGTGDILADVIIKDSHDCYLKIKSFNVDTEDMVITLECEKITYENK